MNKSDQFSGLGTQADSLVKNFKDLSGQITVFGKKLDNI